MIRGNNLNNGTNVGFGYVNVNNVLTNSRTNIGARLNAIITQLLPVTSWSIASSHSGLSNIALKELGKTLQMKRVGYIFEEMVSVENLKAAYREAALCKSKRKKQIQGFGKRLDLNVNRIHHRLVSGTWDIFGYRKFIKKDGPKERTIHWNPCFADNVVQHAIARTAGKVLINSLIEDTYAGIPGRGIHKGVKRMKKFISEYTPEQNLYILKMDVKKFYQSIDGECLKQMIAWKIKDPRVLDIFNKIIDSHSPGLPIGNYLSQLLANYYLSFYDHYIKSRGIRHYARYCDDIVILSSDKSELCDVLEATKEIFKTVGLQLKENYQIYPIERSNGLDFLGYVFTRTQVRMRKSIERKFRAAVAAFQQTGSAKALRTLSSYWGWIKWLSHGNRFWNAFFTLDIREMNGGL